MLQLLQPIPTLEQEGDKILHEMINLNHFVCISIG